jgi:hypothetical protein
MASLTADEKRGSWSKLLENELKGTASILPISLVQQWDDVEKLINRNPLYLLLTFLEQIDIEGSYKLNRENG